MIKFSITDKIQLKKHQFGRIDDRMKVGPVTWPFFDLLWIHEGAVRMNFIELKVVESLNAPAGVLILPNTLFEGVALNGVVIASVCHFDYCEGNSSNFLKPGFIKPKKEEQFFLQHQVRLALRLAQNCNGQNMERRQRLLHSILDGFETSHENANPGLSVEGSRLETAWEMAKENLSTIRTLSDVARLIGISESGFRNQHRALENGSAGKYLREIRLKRGEELLSTTGFNLSEIARQVGYQHSESFCTSFKKSRGVTPGHYRRWSKPFA